MNFRQMEDNMFVRIPHYVLNADFRFKQRFKTSQVARDIF